MKVSIQQAAANAFAAWLATQLTDIVVEPRWPAPDKQRPASSITVVTAGRRNDLPIDLRLIKKTNVGDTQGMFVWQIAACTQPFQLDVWTQSDVARDDILARLDEVLYQDQGALPNATDKTPGHGVLIAVADGWDDSGTIADFMFEEPSTETTSDSAGRSLYRATFRGHAYFMLTVTATTARQAAINFKLQISETDPSTDDFTTYGVT